VRWEVIVLADAQLPARWYALLVSIAAALRTILLEI
jgi:hypothetical protein